MKVSNITNSKGNKVQNQFIISGENVQYFQSYNFIIIKRSKHKIYLDEKYWDYSTTTEKYRNQFLGETKKETQKKIDSGEYILTNLN